MPHCRCCGQACGATKSQQGRAETGLRSAAGGDQELVLAADSNQRTFAAGSLVLFVSMFGLLLGLLEGDIQAMFTELAKMPWLRIFMGLWLAFLHFLSFHRIADIVCKEEIAPRGTYDSGREVFPAGILCPRRKATAFAPGLCHNGRKGGIFMKRAYLRKLTAAALLAALLLSPVLAAEELHPAYLGGFPDGSIRPESTLTREQLAQALYRLIPEAQRTELTAPVCFSDVPPSRWSSEAVTAMVNLGVLYGTGDGAFCPEAAVNAPELAAALMRAAASETARACLPELAAGWDAQSFCFETGGGWVMGLEGTVFYRSSRSRAGALPKFSTAFSAERRSRWRACSSGCRSGATISTRRRRIFSRFRRPGRPTRRSGSTAGSSGQALGETPNFSGSGGF